MFVVVLVLLVTMTLAGLVVAYVAFPHQGKEIPHAEWLSGAMVRAADKVRAPEDVARR